MALDTTVGGAAADSYGDLVAIKARWDAVGYDYTSKTDAEIEIAARTATDAMFGYSSRLCGKPETVDQRLLFPAIGVDIHGYALPSGVIPIDVFYAQCELAYRELSVPNSLTPDIVMAGSKGQLKRRKTDVLEREFFQANSAADLIPRLTSAENLLARYLKTTVHDDTDETKTQVRLRAVGT